MTWRTVPGFELYQVSDAGEIRRRSTGTIATPKPNHNGYHRVRLSREDGTHAWRRVHVLVLEAFRGPRPTPRHHGAHCPDRDKSNNTLANLKWSTPEENEHDKRHHGTVSRRTPGADDHTPARTVRRIHARVARGHSYSEIGRDLGLHRHSVSRIARGLRRAEVSP